MKLNKVRNWSELKKHIIISGVVLLTAALATGNVHAQASGKISKNFYRLPFANGVQMKVNQDYIDHGATPAGNTGPMDITATLAGQGLVAAAAGSVLVVFDQLNGCGCHSNYAPCANVIQILHANGEWTNYLHLAQNSAVVNVGDIVSKGQAIATEGDVGWTCGNTRSPTTSSCIPTVPPGAGNCGRHLHWEVRRVNSNEFVNPIICNISGNLLADNGVYTGVTCGDAGGCSSEFSYPSPTNFTGMGNFEVKQATDRIYNTGEFVTQDSAAVVFHSGNRITLLPGFHAFSNSYFRAEIGPCEGQ